MTSLKQYIKEFLIKENNKPPSWIRKGVKAIHKNKEVEVIEPDIRGPFSLVDTKGDGEGDTSINHDELEKDNEES